jgi:hypothetical protein
MLCVLSVAGCAPVGLLYADTVTPYSRNFRETPVGSKTCVIDEYQLKEPVTRVGLSAQWTTEVILTETRKAGIKEIYSIDKRSVSVLLGIYKHDSLIVHGD